MIFPIISPPSFEPYIQTITATGSGTLIVPSGATVIEYVEIYGGGGGGTAGGKSTKDKASAGAGGGGGGCVVVENIPVSDGLSITYFVGSGGIAAPTKDDESGAGADTWFQTGDASTKITAYGGAKSTVGVVDTVVIQYFGGAGGGGTYWQGPSGTSKYLVKSGESGTNGTYSTSVIAGGAGGAAAATVQTNGGASQHHSGGAGGTPSSNSNAGGGGAPGGGGGGGSNSTSYIGGAGGNGRIYIKWS